MRTSLSAITSSWNVKFEGFQLPWSPKIPRIRGHGDWWLVKGTVRPPAIAFAFDYASRRPARPSFESLGAFPGSLADYRLALSSRLSLSLSLPPSLPPPPLSPEPRLHFAVSLLSSVCPFPSSRETGGARRQRSSHVRVRRGLSRLTLLQGWSLK